MSEGIGEVKLNFCFHVSVIAWDWETCGDFLIWPTIMAEVNIAVNVDQIT